MAGVNLARFQRTSEGAEHSTGGCGNDIVDCGGVRLCQFRGINFVMLGDGAVDAEYYGHGFAGQVRDAQRPLAPFYMGFRNVNNLVHDASLPRLKILVFTGPNIYLC